MRKNKRYQLEQRLIAILNYCYYKKGQDLVHYNDVVNVYRKRFGNDVSVETITRALRKLREKGLIAGGDGRFMPIKAWLPDRALMLYERCDL